MGPTFGRLQRSRLPQLSASPDYEYERFSPDVDWMPRTVMLAKSIYVWLDQLSRCISPPGAHRLDQIPDEELDMLGAPRLQRAVADRRCGSAAALRRRSSR